MSAFAFSTKRPAGGTTIDLRGYTVLPGWIDTHVHFDSHFDRTGRIATDSEPPLEASLGIAAAAWNLYRVLVMMNRMDGE